MSLKEHNALKELEPRNGIIITAAAKGATAVILDVNDCVKEAE